MPIEKFLSHFEEDVDTLKEHIAIIRNKLRITDLSKDDRLDIENSMFEFFRVLHTIDSVSIRVTDELHKILYQDSTDDDTNTEN
jgi:hypothetical protein